MSDLLLTPNDILFFRDARPMAAGQGYGHGANMPLPHQLYSALRTALLKQEGALPTEKGETTGRNRQRKRKGKAATTAFCNMKTIGPFLHHEDYGVLLPIPKDVLAIEKSLVKTSKLICSNQKALAVSTIPPSKKRVDGFWTAEQFTSYLCEETYTDMTPISYNQLWEPEWRLGIGVDPQTQATVDGKIYAAEYLRPTKKMAFAAQIVLGNQKDDEGIELLSNGSLLFGGDRRLVHCENKGNLIPKFAPPTASGDGSFIVKWTLLTPAIFKGGSLPGWCMPQTPSTEWPQGRVCLWGIDNSAPQAKLLTQQTGDPMIISGWDAVEGHPKASLKAVSAGATYWFHCDSAQTATQLAKKLHASPRSDMFGEKGYGFGVCSINETKINL